MYVNVGFYSGDRDYVVESMGDGHFAIGERVWGGTAGAFQYNWFMEWLEEAELRDMVKAITFVIEHQREGCDQ